VSLLDLVDLSFGYPYHPVGHGVHLRLDAGETVALLGPNGSGKTTLFRTILGALRPLGGDIRIEARRSPPGRGLAWPGASPTCRRPTPGSSRSRRSTWS
jgi:ABC-type Mn2+/Zn2+ transport system ATPase subunit